MLKQIWSAISLAGLVFGADILQLSYSDDKKEAIPLGTFEIDSTPEGKLTVKTVDLQKVETSGQYCLNAEIEGKLDMPCFSNMKLGMPLKYDLIVDVDDNNEINQLSLSYNEKNDAIVGVVRYPETGPSAPVAKLKKKTKTYADKKASKNKDGSTAQFEEDDEEVKEVSWFQKNWKMMILGLLIYNFVVGSMKKKQQAPAAGQKTE